MAISKETKMTNRIIVATFDDTKSAYEAARMFKALKDEERSGFKLKTGVMVEKDRQGNVSLLETKHRSLFGTAVGTAAGALIGLIGGPPGMALGAMIGASAGAATYEVKSGFDEDFVSSVVTDMSLGKTAIIVEADEMSTRPIDDIVSAHGGHIYRQVLPSASR
jgi:uncharacterized membrane protein